MTSMTLSEHDFLAGYIEGMFFANSLDGTTEELESVDFRESAIPTESARKRMQEDCLDFFGANQKDLEYANEHPTEGRSFYDMGCDFALSRNRHGSGFFDRGRDPVWMRLQNAAKVYGEQMLIVDKDGNAEIA